MHLLSFVHRGYLHESIHSVEHAYSFFDRSYSFLMEIKFVSQPAGIRQIIIASIHLVQTSCGYGVPLMELQKDRETMARWATSKGEEGLVEYRGVKNKKSLDGLSTPLTQQYEG